MTERNTFVNILSKTINLSLLSSALRGLRFVSLAVLFLLLSGLNQQANERNTHEGYQFGPGKTWVKVSPPVTAEEIARIEAAITQVASQMGFNGNISVSRYGYEIYSQSFGYADPIKKTPLNEETAFQLASVSKQFTALAVLLLRDRGFFELDEPVKKYIPEYPYDQVSIKHLLTHTAGMQNYMALTERQWKKSEMPSNADVPVMFAQSKLGLNFKPGARFQYSNAAYAMLGLLIEKVSGESYPDFMHKNIFKPLKMENTYVYQPDKHTNKENRALGFRKNKRGFTEVKDDKKDYIYGDKGIFSTLSDLNKWDRALYSNIFLPKETLNEAFSFAQTNEGKHIQYGYGFRLDSIFGEKLVYHNGWWHGFRTTFRRYPQMQTTLIILNNTNTELSALTDKIQRILFPELYLLEEPPMIAVSNDDNNPSEGETHESSGSDSNPDTN